MLRNHRCLHEANHDTDMAHVKHSDRILRSFREGYDAYVAGTRDLDLEWFACDRSGLLGVFATGAQLDASPRIVGDRDGFIALVQFILAMPPRGQSMPSQPSLWFDYGSRGLVGYDVPRPGVDLLTYERQYLPSVPLKIGELPTELQTTIQRVSLDADFLKDLVVRVY